MASSTISRRSVAGRAPCRQALERAHRMIRSPRPARRCRGHGRKWLRTSRRRPARRRWRDPTTTSEPQNESAPENRGAPFDRTDGLRSLGFDHLRLAIADRDLARLLRLGNLAHEIDVQESVLEGRTLDLDIVGKLEDALERASRDALIEHLAVVLLVLRLFLAFDRQRVFFVLLVLRLFLAFDRQRVFFRS